MLKSIRNLINRLFLPCVDDNYVTMRLNPDIVHLHGITIGESSLSFRERNPIEEYRFPLKDSESTENHIKYEDIAIILERTAFMEILLWNGYMYSLSKDRPSKQFTNTYRDVRNMSYFAMLRPVTPEEVGRNMNREVYR